MNIKPLDAYGEQVVDSDNKKMHHEEPFMKKSSHPAIRVRPQTTMSLNNRLMTKSLNQAGTVL